MRKILFAVLSASIALSCFSQKNSVKQILIEPKILIIAGPGLDFGIGDFSDTHSLGFSGTVGGYAKVSNTVRTGISIDENYFIGKKIPGYGQQYDGENILRLTTSAIITTKGSIILELNAGVANVSSGGDSETNFTWGVKAGIPVLGSLPLLGKIFSSKGHTAAGADLLFFITPHTIRSTDE